LSRIAAVFFARNREYLRDRSAMAWNFLFPVLVVVGFAYAFSGNPQPIFKVGVLLPSGATLESLRPQDSFLSTPQVEWVAIADGGSSAARESALGKLSHHAYDLLWSPSRYWVNESSPKGQVLERLLRSESPAIPRETVQGRAVRYVDWLISGLLAMNMMFSALFGVGYNIVRYRKTGVLKRLKATPLRAWEFLVAQVGSRIILLSVVSSIVYGGTHALVHFQMRGSYLDLIVVLLLGATCLVSLGLLVASRISSEEFAGGLLNLLSWPMIFLSGVWFSLEGAHPIVQAAAKVLPLTHVIDAARAIMIDGATLSQVFPQIGALAAMTAAFLALGAWSFRWE
jgi:ABC-type polysaccharide/polyol phosphate export permease